MKIHWKKLCATVVGFFGIGALTACYGMPPNERFDCPLLVYGKVYSLNKDGDSTKIANITVSVKCGKQTYMTKSDSNGFYQLNLPDTEASYTLVFEDRNSQYKKDSTKVEFSNGITGKECNFALNAN